METDHVADADTHAAIAKRLGMDYAALLTEVVDTEYTHAIIRDRAAEALRERGYCVTGPYSTGAEWFLKDVRQCSARTLDARALGRDDYPSALLAALTLAGIGGDDAAN